MFDANHIRDLAAQLQTNERYIEKDWHVVRALSAIAALKLDGVMPVFSGGTSLATAWQLIRRFSEDIDFKVEVKGASASAARRMRSVYREHVFKALSEAGFIVDGEPLVGNESRFFSASFRYGATFPAAAGVRPTVRIEMTFTGTRLPPVARPVQSLLGRALRAEPEVSTLLCVDPVETAADKISALAWRTAVRDRRSKDDDPSIVRHLHDLAALAPLVASNRDFGPLARTLLDADARRTKIKDATGLALLQSMLRTITSDALWKQEYGEFVGAVSYGPEAGRISFEQAIKACEELTSIILPG